jgi:hypothetical protein
MEEYYEYKENMLWNWYITFNLLHMSNSNVNPTSCCHYHMFTWMNYMLFTLCCHSLYFVTSSKSARNINVYV